MMQNFRREGPRIDVEALCWELVDGKETSGLAVDLSPIGLRIERPYVPGPTRHTVPLEIEVPGIDEVMWARAEACYDVLLPSKTHGIIRRTGYVIAGAASRDLRMLEEFVVETHRARRATYQPAWLT
ncbi:MAG TPA: hypothetical protein VIU61_23695 [Kofleriaceae bacterium]